MSAPTPESYLRHLEVERRMAPNTLDAYRRDLDQLAAFAAAQRRPLIDLTRSHLEEFVRELMASGLSAASTARLVASTRGFFRFLRLIGAVAANPAEDLQAPRAFASLPRFLSLDDVDALLAAPDTSTPRGVRDRTLIEVLYATGLRVSELVGLRVTDVRVDQGYVQCLGKGRKQRIVPLGDTAADWVRRYVAEGRPEPHARTPDGVAVRERTRRRPAVTERVLEAAEDVRTRSRPADASQSARAASFLRDAPARARRGSARHPGHARPRRSVDDADLHPRFGGASAAGVRPVSPEGLR